MRDDLAAAKDSCRECQACLDNPHGGMRRPYILSMSALLLLLLRELGCPSNGCVQWCYTPEVRHVLVIVFFVADVVMSSNSVEES